ncbi:transglycosylase domain-containing protein [Pseudorhizobium pelagicum]|uniref:Penicillin-binding protein n=1 Tax=Pseudorhizobium pelagicum TaxID=1509405 RepID=A0A922T968_9HYPH|nr:transglycosylase domain-containing protein [Pseudorhizobium pelagicum]KEQ04328.1 penicillin-binding protein [Pseudorhizobium pelagicum]KEQ07306.1 penicillin-binding protein [Pseudorhizobium pelagicum]
MAAKGKSRHRIEPSFEDDEDRFEDDLRLGSDDRVVGGRPKRKSGPAKKPAASSSRRKSKTRRQSRGLFAPVRSLLYWCLVLGIWAGIGIGGLVLYYGAQMPAASAWAIPDRPPNIKIVSTNGSVIANRGATGGEALSLEEMSPYIPQAVMAIEDRRFYSHFGVDPFGLARAFINNLTGQPIQGGSTITQQLAKNLFLSPERTFERKIQEVLLAFWLEHKFNKDQILAMYLNRVFFGSNAYGVEAASRRYFNTSAREVNLGQAALLAGLLKAPSRLSPARDPEAAEARAQVVLGAMQEEGYVTEDEIKSAMSQPPTKARSYWSGAEHYAADMVLDEVTKLVGEVKQDIVVETTIDLSLERKAEEALTDILEGDGEKLNASQAALVSMDATGAIRALVGGKDYAQSQFNRAVTAKRQPGSAFKPFVYAAALEAGIRPDSIRNDAPVRIGKWTPENYDQKYRGEVTVSSALAQSLNTIAAQLVMEVGPQEVVSLAHRMGIEQELQPNASIALGTSEVPLVELTAAYAPFMNGGYKATPHIVRRILDAEGNTIYETGYDSPPRVLSETVVATMNSMLTRVIENGTGKAAKLKDWQAAGKTGTTQSFRDALFVGYTSVMTTGIWFGNDDGTSMKKVTGGGLPAKAWKDYMTAALDGYSPTPLFGSHGGFDLPPASIEPEREPTSIGDIISGVLPGVGRRDNYPTPPAADVYQEDVSQGEMPIRDYREYRGPYDDFGGAPVPPADVGGRPMPPVDAGATASTRPPRQTTLYDLIMGQ